MNLRPAVVVGVAWLGSAWCAAEAPQTAPTAAEQLRLFQTNRQLLEQLLNHGVRLSESTSSLQRAEESRAATMTLAAAVQAAARGDTPERVAELGDHLGTIWTVALLPTLTQARQEINPVSPEYRRLQHLQQQAIIDIDRIEEQFQQADSLPPLIRQQLQRIRQQLQDQSEPPR